MDSTYAAKTEAFSTQEVLEALGDPEVSSLPPGPLKTFIDKLNQRVTVDYDQYDVILILVHPPQNTRLHGN